MSDDIQAYFAKNPWQLYQSMEGWEVASAELEAALKEAISEAHMARANGTPKGEATMAIRVKVNKVMKKYCNFGAMDSEGFHRLEAAIEREFN